MKGGREDVVHGRLEPQVSGVNYLLQEVWFSTGGLLCLPADIWDIRTRL